MKTKVAIIGSGNIGTDLMIKILRTSNILEVGALVGIDPSSDGLARAKKMGVSTTADGIDGLVTMPEFNDTKILFDATSAGAHAYHDKVSREHGKTMIDMTPAAIGPYVVPVVNLDKLLDAPNINMVTCGGQATIPMVDAVKKVAHVHYAEIVASIASKSAGPGTRANIDEFTETTSRCSHLSLYPHLPVSYAPVTPTVPFPSVIPSTGASTSSTVIMYLMTESLPMNP